MQSFEQWADDYLKKNGWKQTVAEILRIYELSATPVRDVPFDALMSSWELLNSANKAESFRDIFKNDISQLRTFYKLPTYMEIDYKEFDSYSEISRHIVSELQNNAKTELTAPMLAGICKTYQHSESTGLYALLGIVIRANWKSTRAEAECILCIIHRLLFTYKLKPILTQVNMQRATSADVDYVVRGNIFLYGR